MQKGRNMQYVAAGVQAAPGMRMNVRSNVRLPDSEAGRVWAQERQPYHAVQVRQTGPRTVSVPMNAALLFLCALFVVFGALALGKASQRAELSKKISAMESSIAQTERDNMLLAVQIAEARDSARISYAASQSLGMISSTGVEAVPILAPDTRPYENNAKAQTEASPNSAPGGMIAGSR